MKLKVKDYIKQYEICQQAKIENTKPLGYYNPYQYYKDLDFHSYGFFQGTTFV